MDHSSPMPMEMPNGSFGLLHRTFPNVRIVGEESEEDMARGQVGLWKSLHETSEATDAETTGTAPTNGTATSVSPGTKRKWKDMEEDREGTILVTIEKEIALRVSTHLKNNKNDKDDDAKDNDDEKDKVFVDPSRVSVFVDPLDGTSAYAKGQYKFVTILINCDLVSNASDDTPAFYGGPICASEGSFLILTTFRNLRTSVNQSYSHKLVSQEYGNDLKVMYT